MCRCHDLRRIEMLLYVYAERIDAGDFEGAADLFTDAELISSGGAVARGREAVLARLLRSVRRHGDETPLTRHVVTNPIIELEEEVGLAAARSSITVFQAVPGSLPLQPIWVGSYHDEFERIDGEWRFRRRSNIGHLTGDLTQHLDMP